MFHKEGSCVDIVSTGGSSQGGGKAGNNKRGNTKGKSGKGGKAQHPTEQTTNTSKAVDVPLRKSDRRRLRDRAAAYFLGGIHVDDNENDDDNDNHNNQSNTVAVDNGTDEAQNTPGKTNSAKKIEALLEEIFTKGGTISSRSLPAPTSTTTTGDGSNTKGNHESMILYVKSPNQSGDDDKSSSSGFRWPYQNKPQFVWMAVEDKKSGRVIRESPTISLIAVLWHSIEFSTTVSEHLHTSRIVRVPSAVSRYLCRGADLMRAGIFGAPDGSSNLAAGGADEARPRKPKKNKGKKEDPLESSKDMVLVCVHGNPQPFAVGRSVLYCEQTKGEQDAATPPFGPGTKGIGVEIWSCYGDDLWRTTTASASYIRATYNGGDAAVNLEDGSYGNPGFVRTRDGELRVLPVVEVSSDEEDDQEEEEEGADQKDESGADRPEKQQEGGLSMPPPSDTNAEGENSKGNDANSSEKRPALDNEEENSEINNDDKETSSAKQKETEETTDSTPDDLFHETVCRALVHLGKNDLPISVGTFYTKFVVPHRPKGIESMTDLMKETTYKKFGNYLKRWQQKGDENDDDGFGLLKTGPDPSNRNNKDPNALLISYNKRHSDLRGIKKTKRSTGDSGNGKTTKVVVVTLHVVPSNWTKLMRLDSDAVEAANATSAERRGTGMLTLPEVRKILDNYLERELLRMKGSSMKRKVALDGPLTVALYGKGSSNETTPAELSPKDLYTKFAARMSPAFCLVEMPGSNVLKLAHGKPPPVQIEVVRRQSRKFVTRLRGLEEYYFNGIEPAVFCKDVSKRLAISGSIDADPSSNGRAALPKKGHVEYVFGANIVDELEALLTGDETLSEHGGVKGGDWPYPRIPSAVIEVVLRKGVPARKKRRQHGSSGNR